MFAAQENHEHNSGVHAGFAIAVVSIIQILKSFFFVAAQSDQRDRHPHRQRQASHHIVMGSHNQFGIGVLRSQLENPFMVTARSHRIAQSRKPGALDQCSVKRELAAGNAAGIEHIHVIRIARQFRVFQFLGLLHQLLDALFLRGIGGTVRLSDEIVVRVLPGIHRAHAIQFPHLNRREQMIHRKRIVRMTRQDPLEILNRCVIVKVVVVLESGRVQRHRVDEARSR